VKPGIQEFMRQIERVWDTYQRDVHVGRDLDAAMAATGPETSLVNVPVMTGGRDREGVRRYLAEDLLPHLPVDLIWRRVSRTVDRFRVVDETLVGFTHDRKLPWLLPGAAPTNRPAEVLAVTVATLRQGKIVAQRTLWDHARLAAQLGLGDVTGRPPEGVAPAGRAEPAGWW
jgi:carboxymethylenebutenolidase